MRSKFSVFLTLTLMLIINACAPFAIAEASGEQPTPEVETIPTTGYQPVDVDQVEVEVGVGSPIPVLVTATGNLPDSCAQIELVRQKQEGTHFEVTLSTIPSNTEGCVQDTLPFRITIPLNITNLPTGSYSVEVNGSRADFEVNTANTTSSLPTADSVITRHDIQVSSVTVETGVGSPVPVHAIIGPSLANSCAQIGEIRLHRDGKTFYVQLIADVAERRDCYTVDLPFRLELPLNIAGLAEGPYQVIVNGTTTSFDPHATPAAATSLDDVEKQLQAALLQRDAAGMQALMGERFLLADWQSESAPIPSEEAVTRLLSSYITESSALEFREFQNIPAFDAQRFVGPGVEPAKTIYVSGWGTDGQGQALLIVSRRPDGSLFWQGVLVVPKGFVPPMGQACSEPVAVSVVDGQASYNGITFNIDLALNFGLTARICSASTAEEQQMSNEAHPPYTEFFFPTYSRSNVDYQPHIRVYEVTGELESYLFPLKSLDELRTTLEQRPEPVTWFQHSPLHVREAYLDFGNGSGVRGLVQYMQDYFFYTNNGLLYEFHGLTQDGRHFVSVRFPASVPFLMELKGITLPPDNINPTAISIPAWPSDYEQQRKVIEAYNSEALRRFEQISDSDVFPNLALLDQLVQSIQISQP